jgi:hypothetical protein
MPLTIDRQQFIQALAARSLVLPLKSSVCQRGGCQMEQVIGKTLVAIDAKPFYLLTESGLSVFVMAGAGEYQSSQSLFSQVYYFVVN